MDSGFHTAVSNSMNGGMPEIHQESRKGKSRRARLLLLLLWLCLLGALIYFVPLRAIAGAILVLTWMTLAGFFWATGRNKKLSILCLCPSASGVIGLVIEFFSDTSPVSESLLNWVAFGAVAGIILAANRA